MRRSKPSGCAPSPTSCRHPPNMSSWTRSAGCASRDPCDPSVSLAPRHGPRIALLSRPVRGDSLVGGCGDESRRSHFPHVADDLVVDEAGLLGHFPGRAHHPGRGLAGLLRGFAEVADGSGELAGTAGRGGGVLRDLAGQLALLADGTRDVARHGADLPDDLERVRTAIPEEVESKKNSAISHLIGRVVAEGFCIATIAVRTQLPPPINSVHRCCYISRTSATGLALCCGTLGNGATPLRFMRVVSTGQFRYLGNPPGSDGFSLGRAVSRTLVRHLLRL